MRGFTKYIAVCIVILITSFFYFPINTTYIPAANSKMILAVIGLVVLVKNLTTKRQGFINKDFLTITLFACGVSLASLLSMAYNDTPDDIYFTYVISMFVWTSAAYASISAMKVVHGKVNVELICYYLAGMCALQCLLAILIDSNASVKSFIDSIYIDSGYLNEKKRLYGLGAALDIAGGRFAAVLIMIAFMLIKAFKENYPNYKIAFLLTSFGIISVIGNSIGRTTTMGMLIAIAVIGISILIDMRNGETRSARWILSFFFAAVITTIILYQTDPKWQKYLEFGFEGFFSLVEKGKWEVQSNDMLKEGIIFPDNLKTWIIGDGYFENMQQIDPYYIGKSWYGFYQGTDAGYSRFLFYFGVIGLTAFSLFLAKVTQICMRNYPTYKYMFPCILLLNFIIWIKVTTDIYVAFASFVALLYYKDNPTDTNNNTDESQDFDQEADSEKPLGKIPQQSDYSQA